MAIAGIYFYQISDNEIKSDSGQIIGRDESYFYNKEADSKLTLAEGEVELLGLRDVSTAERKSLAKKGNALPDGSYPIANCKDAANAIRSIGRAPESKRGKVRSHIRKRVKELGCSGSIFENWK